MKNTGLVRRIDELGRIVIPRPIRDRLHIADGDVLEIWIDDNSICLKPTDEDIKLCHLRDFFDSMNRLAKSTMNLPLALYVDNEWCGGDKETMLHSPDDLHINLVGLYGGKELVIVYTKDNFKTCIDKEGVPLLGIIQTLSDYAEELWGE